jgi:hypothetical protein
MAKNHGCAGLKKTSGKLKKGYKWSKRGGKCPVKAKHKK